MKRLLILLLLIAVAPPAWAHDAAVEADAVGVSRRALGNTLPDLRFVDTSGRTVRLADYRGRPLLVGLIYTACTDVCPLLVQQLYQAVAIGQETFGRDAFAVLTVGFDAANDTPQRMRSFARQQGVDLPNWEFLSGDQATIDRLAGALGFTLIPSAGGFSHMAQISVVDGDGRIYRQVYGNTFSVNTLIEPLKDLVYGRERRIQSFADLVGRVKLFCTIYNPSTGRYEIDYSVFIGIGIGLACLMLVLLWLVGEYRRSAT